MKDKRIVKNKGFTLMEVVVTLFIVVLMYGIIFINHRQSGQVLALQRSANKLAQDIRRVEQYAMAATPNSVCMGNLNYKYGSGIYFDTGQPDQYILFADCDYTDIGYDSSIDSPIETINLEKGITITSLSGSPLTITFSPPDPKVTINHAPPAFIKLEAAGRTKTISVNEVGLIEIQ
jgi:prepilin-type N-terminal cleavage/methylation domain-containing protein